MRIIKLSPAEFPTFKYVQDFFLKELPGRTPPGKFRIPPGHIAKEKFDEDESLIFTYQSRVRFKARSQSRLKDNEDNEAKKYPYYFVIDLETLQSADTPLRDTEQKYREISGQDVNWEGQGWNVRPESKHTSALWNWVR
jgi:hypothetical protein